MDNAAQTTISSQHSSVLVNYMTIIFSLKIMKIFILLPLSVVDSVIVSRIGTINNHNIAISIVIRYHCSRYKKNYLILLLL